MAEARALQAIAFVTQADTEAQLQERLQAAAEALGGRSAVFCLRIHRPPLDPVEHVIRSIAPTRPTAAWQAGEETHASAALRAESHGPGRAWGPGAQHSQWGVLESQGRPGAAPAMAITLLEGRGARSKLIVGPLRKAPAGAIVDVPSPDGMRLLAHAMHIAVQRVVIPRLLANIAPRLTERELTCLHWVAQGKSDGVVATILGVSDSAVHFHMTNVLRKLGVATRTQAVAKALALRLLR